MKLLTRLIDIILYTSVFTACCATGLCMATERLITMHSPPLFNSLHILVFGSTLLVYNTPRIVRKPRAGKPEKESYQKWHFTLFLTGMSMTLFGLYGQLLRVQLASVFLGMFAFAYFLPLLPFGRKRRLRDFGWLKIIVLAGVWTVATSVLPILYWQKNIHDYPFEILVRLVFIFTLCLIFDIRDIRADISNNINTLPNKVGLRNSYVLINIALLVFIALSAMQYYRHPSVGRLVGSLVTALITRLIVSYLQKHPSEKGYFILADGVMVLYASLVLIS